MQFCRYLDPDRNPQLGIARGGDVIALSSIDNTLPGCLRALMQMGDELPRRLSGWEEAAPLPETPPLLAPITDPQKIICVGLNYRDHAEETGRGMPTEPVIFGKYPSTIIGPEDEIRLPKVSDRVDYEAELVVVIGQEGRNVSAADANDVIFGYCCGHDVSSRDWQFDRSGGQWMLGKSFDTFAPLGPFIAHRSLIPNAGSLDIQLRLNGEVMQQSNTSQLIFDIPTVIEHLTQVVTLKPGDLIFTGTPSGVGAARKPPRYLQDGDVCEVEIESLGTLRNRCVKDL